MRRSRAPVSRMGWHAFYAQRFCKTETDSSAHMANWYHMLALADDEVTP